MKKYLAMLAVVLMGWSCDKYDDTALKGRIDGLEDRVTKLEQQLKTLNDGYEAIQKLVGDGFVTGFVENGDSYTITVKNADGSSKNYTLKKAEKGDKGDKGDTGAAGKDGSTPVFTLGGPDSEGRYWWLIDGVEAKDANGNRVYASGTNGTNGSDGQPGQPGQPGTPGDKGDKGDQGDKGDKGDQGDKGEDGVTPHLAVAPEKDGQPDFSNDDATAVLHWWVSYDWDGDDATATWEDLGVAKGQADDVVITASFENGHLKIFVNGVEQVSVEIGTGFEISFSIEDKTVEQFATVEFEEGETLDIQVVLGGEKADDFAVEARLQNAGSWDVYVEDDVISVTRTGDNATKLFVEVINDGKYIKTWVTLAIHQKLNATLSIPALSKTGYLPVANGTVSFNKEGINVNFETEEAFPNLPETVRVELVIELEEPASADYEFSFKYYGVWDTPIEGFALESETVSIKQGETSVITYATFPRSSITGDCYEEIALYYGDDRIDYADILVAKNFPVGYYKMSVDMFNNQFDNADNSKVSDIAEKGYGTAGMIDGDPDTFMRSTQDGNKFNSNDWWKLGVTYGEWFDVTMPEGVAVLAVKYQNSNNYIPTEIKYATAADVSGLPSNPTAGNSTLNKESGDWNTIPLNQEEMGALRFGVYSAATNGTSYPMRSNSAWGSIWTYAIAEFELWVMY